MVETDMAALHAAAHRGRAADAFVARSGWAGSRRVPLAGDASARRYHRLIHPRLGTAVLMDADPSSGETTLPFATMARHLSGLGLSAPQIHASDFKAGFLLLEDFGDAAFPGLIDADPGRAGGLYLAATRVLDVVQAAAPPPGLAAPDGKRMAEYAALALDWYAPVTSSAGRAEFAGLLASAWDEVADNPPVLLLRDHHAGNLMWLPHRDDVAQVGLLDFQDAHLGNRCYDLVSLLEDARRDVPTDLRDTLRGQFARRNGLDQTLFARQWAVTAVQRHLRILGIFARLAHRDGKTRYLAMMPRVWGQLQQALAAPGLARLRGCVLAMLPEPDQAMSGRVGRQ